MSNQWKHDVDVLWSMPSAQPEPLMINFAREIDRETYEKLKKSMANAPVLIMAMNDVQPERKKGKWIEQEEYECVYYECSACGEPWTTIDGTPQDNGMNYCPNCGAKMEVQDD